MSRILLLVFLVCATPFAGFGQALNVNQLMEEFDVQMREGNYEEALTIGHQITVLQPESPAGYYARAKAHQEAGRHYKAVSDYTEALKFASKSPQLYYDRGSENLRLGRIDEALADFAKTAELQPTHTPRLWQRGIALYEAGKFDMAERQFKLHQLVNSNDVENVVWHFISVAKDRGLAEATNSLLTVENDNRVPMMQVYSLFQGKGKVEDVFKIARFGYPPDDELKRRMFYANFYIGLYYEAKEDNKRAVDYISKAVSSAPPKDYMRDVAKLHLAVLKKRMEEQRNEAKKKK